MNCNRIEIYQTENLPTRSNALDFSFQGFVVTYGINITKAYRGALQLSKCPNSVREVMKKHFITFHETIFYGSILDGTPRIIKSCDAFARQRWL